MKRPLFLNAIRNFHFFGKFLSKWPPATILDNRKSLSIAFLTISDQYATFCLNIFSKWPPVAILDPAFAKIDRDLTL